MDNIIAYLICQDLRHNQLIKNLENEGRDVELYYLDIMTVVGQLMGLPEKEISDQFANIYSSFMDEVEKYDVTGKGENLVELAGRCYQLLLSCCEIEKRINIRIE